MVVNVSHIILLQPTSYKLGVADYFSKNGLNSPSYIDLEIEDIKYICMQFKNLLTTFYLDKKEWFNLPQVN